MATFIIAEAGVNHNGDINLARELVDVAAEAGADAVKFQSFSAGRLVSSSAPKAEYQKRMTDAAESQFDMIRRLELSEHDHYVLKDHAEKQGIRFLSSPFDIVSLNILTKKMEMLTIKIPSGEITNAPFLLAIARSAPSVILSTGMSTLSEVEAALGVLAFGFCSPPDAVPQRGSFERVFASDEGQLALKRRVVLLHCTTEYPAPVGEVNLRAMDTLASAFGLSVGYSDHTLGVHISLAAVARGASVIEKHFTLDRNMPGPDHKASLIPSELKDLVQQIRDIEIAMGDGIKKPTQAEWKNRDIARKSLVAATAITKGQSFSEENLTCKRPGSGQSPFAYWHKLEQKAASDYAPDEVLDG
jgi:N-acetylneuraminate synthase